MDSMASRPRARARAEHLAGAEGAKHAHWAALLPPATRRAWRRTLAVTSLPVNVVHVKSGHRGPLDHHSFQALAREASMGLEDTATRYTSGGADVTGGATSRGPLSVDSASRDST